MGTGAAAKSAARVNILLSMTVIWSGTSKQWLVLGGEKRKTLCTQPLSIDFPWVRKSSAKAKAQPWPPGYKHDMKYEREQRCVSQRRGQTKRTCLSTVHWVTSTGRLLPNTPRSYHNQRPSRVLVPRGWRKHWETMPFENKGRDTTL